MKRCRNRNKSNKKAFSPQAARNEFCNAGSRFYDGYCMDETAMQNEERIADLVRQHGDSEIIHVDYIASIMTLVHAYVSKESPTLVMYKKTPAVDFGTFLVMELITLTTYEMRQGILGLKQNQFSRKMLSLDIMESTLVAPIDKAALKLIMAHVEKKTVDALSELELGKTEDILVPWGQCVSCFEFYKILAKVMLLMDVEKWEKVQGVSYPYMLIVCYDIANRIYDRYIDSCKDAA